eukprot:IDg11927t1
MVKCGMVVCSVVSMVAFLLFVVGTATEHWINFAKSGGSANPVIVNTQLAVGAGLVPRSEADTTRRVEYAASNYGLWTACYREKKGALSCAFVGLRCGASVCWTRRSNLLKARACQRGRVYAIPRCVAFQLARLAFLVAGVFAVFGVAVQLVAAVATSRTLAMLAGIGLFTSGLFMVVGFAVFYAEEFARGGVHAVASMGWSLWLIVFAWPLALLSGVISCCTASLETTIVTYPSIRPHTENPLQVTAVEMQEAVSHVLMKGAVSCVRVISLEYCN